MDVGELLSFKPVPTPKRPTEDDSDYSDDEGSRASKTRRIKKVKAEPHMVASSTSFPNEPSITDKEREDILRFVETEATQGEVLDENGVKKLVLLFEKKALKNREMRIKFPDQPEKFMESEIDLHEALQDLSAVATVPDQYPLLVELKCINSLLELLSHDNTDISTKVVHLLQPVPTPKRPTEDDSDYSDDEGSRASKTRRIKKVKAEPHMVASSTSFPNEPSITDKEREDILRFVETEATQGEVLDENGVKKLVLLFEKKALKNREMRIKFPDQPEKFMESEIDLHEALQDLSAVATVPDQYPLLVELKCINSLLELLSHDNTDISTKVVHLLQELSDVDILHESEEGAEELINALVEAEAPALLLHNLSRLDEQIADERDAVHNTLGIIENMAEFRPAICEELGKQGFLQWILKRLKLKVPFDANKLYATEILSILLHTVPGNRKLLGELDGIDVLLQQLAFYKRHDPNGAEEQEAMENMFDSLCCALMEPSNRDRFLRGEGLQLMNLMLREKKMSRNGSLKVLSHALTGPDGRDNCNKFVDILGLRTVFPLFMKTPKKKRLLTIDQHEEHVVSIISSMLRNCQGSQRQRLLAKFTENDYEKVDRLLELHFKYMDKVDRTEKEMEQAGEDLADDAQYFKRLTGGLFTLQLVDRIILEVCTAGPATIKQRVQRVLSLRGGSLKIIRHVMREYAGNLGDSGAGEEDAEYLRQEQQHVLQLVDKF